MTEITTTAAAVSNPKKVKKPPFKMAILQVMQEHGLDKPISNAQILEAFVAKGWYPDTPSTHSFLSQVLSRSAEIEKQSRGSFKANDMGRALLAHQDQKKAKKSPVLLQALKELDINPKAVVEANPFEHV